ncbi:GreA/GreB family elongation factor [Marinomonas algarum]|uniref:GreA/GreB family elongation factor n=1 Tax=Marinomonas algarum TaxID=2883105 RepID=A0A9X1IN65_9GAMM|nr:GreA/GreB family elongation factor [Marinomonas algarum]MCB5161899.1 GreA/GreB family elongation factor [Marinomonas algarum]
MIDKIQTHQAIVAALFARYETAKWAALHAHEAATSKESIAENKYDTFGLEAAYLAHGQSQRVLQCESEWLLFHKKTPIMFDENDAASVWSLVVLENASGLNKHFFLAPCGGGLCIDMEGCNVYLVTGSSPVGKALLGKAVGDEVEIRQSGQQVGYEIVAIV